MDANTSNGVVKVHDIAFEVEPHLGDAPTEPLASVEKM